MMCYINRKPLIIPNEYITRYQSFAVNTRGNLYRNDIYFNLRHLERLFGYKFGEMDVVWMETDAGHIRYLRYNELIAQYRLCSQWLLPDSNVFKFISLINLILKDDSLTDDSLTDDSLTDDSLTDDSLTDDSLSNDNLSDDIQPTQYKIELLLKQLELKDKEIQLKERDLIILNLRMDLELVQKNEIIFKLNQKIISLTPQSIDFDVHSEWI